MATPLNIKDPEAYRLAAEIAAFTGKTLTRVVVDALKHEKEALKPTLQQIDMTKVHAILSGFDLRRQPGERPVDEILKELYDERGLPR